MSSLYRPLGALAVTALLLLLLPTTRAAVPPGTIVTFAGSGAGDGGPATNATIDEPTAIAVNTAGDLYILDSKRCRIRKVIAGIITNAAGNGVCAFSADGSAAQSSPILPTDIALGPDGSLYFTEAHGFNADESCRVRKVSVGLLTTVAGNAICGSPTQGANALSTSLYDPTMLAIDSAGNIYVADKIECRVWKISSGVITRIAGGVSCGITANADPLIALISPADIAVDAAGTNLYIAENDFFASCYIRRVAAGVLTFFAGTGLCGFAADGSPALGSQIAPRNLAVGSTGDVFYADGCSIRRISGGTLATSATCVATGPGGAPFELGLLPQNVAVRGSSEVWMGEWASGGPGTFHACLVKTVQSSAVVTVAGSGDCSFGGDGQLAVYASLSDPLAVGVDGAGGVYIADRNNCRIRKVTAGLINTIAGNSCLPAAWPPLGMAVSATANAVRARSMAVTPAGDAYVFDEDGCRLRKITGGLITTLAGSGCGPNIGDGIAIVDAQFYSMTGIAVSGSTIYVSEGCRIWSLAAGVVLLVAGNGSCTSEPDGTTAKSGGVALPVGLAVYNGDLYFAERDACRVRVIHAGVLATIAGNSTAVSCGFAGDGASATAALLNQPANIAFDGAGTLYIGDTGNCRVRRVQGGLIETTAGSAICGFGGDGGPAANALLATPVPFVPGLGFLSVAVNAHRDVYIADSGNGRIRVMYGDLCPKILRADVDGDGAVSILDLTHVAQYFTQSVPPAPTGYDQDNDGQISILDLTRIATVFAQSSAGCP